uniref:Epstein-Barr virus EBNA-1-like protein n=1 Tax=Oryza sativa subsp. japonica TaxID=39947 RepID=Q6ERZ0_ORYSJ|nr:Epstein-Barr virus EBNA-1-like protein [Oryza sativa Japonica Group]
MHGNSESLPSQVYPNFGQNSDGDDDHDLETGRLLVDLFPYLLLNLAETLKLIVAGLLLEELLVSRIRFIFFSNWGDYLYRARVPDHTVLGSPGVLPDTTPANPHVSRHQGSPDKLVTQPGMSHSTHVVVLILCLDEIPRKRFLSARAENRTPDFKFEGVRRYSRRVHEYRDATRWLQGDMAELAPTWRLRGCHAGRQEVDDDASRNGRRSTAASDGANHGDTGKSEHSGWLHVTRGDEPMSRIRRRELDGGESRRRQPAAGEEENGDEVTRGQFPAARASTRLRESDASVGLGRTTPSVAGDERRFRARAATAASTWRVTATVGAAPASYGEATLCTGSSGHTHDDERRRRTGATAMARRRKRGRLEGEGLGFKWAAMSVWERGTDIGRSSRRAGAPASGQNGDRRDFDKKIEKGDRGHQNPSKFWRSRKIQPDLMERIGSVIIQTRDYASSNGLNFRDQEDSRLLSHHFPLTILGIFIKKLRKIRPDLMERIGSIIVRTLDYASSTGLNFGDRERLDRI